MFLVELRVLHPCNSSNRQWGILTSIPLSVFYNFCHLWSTSSVQRVTSLNVCCIFLKSNCSDQCVIPADLNSFCGFIFDYLSCNRENGSQWRSLCFGNLLTWKWWHDHLNCRFLYGIWYIYSWLPHHCCLCDIFTRLSMKFLMSLFCLANITPVESSINLTALLIGHWNLRIWRCVPFLPLWRLYHLNMV